MMHVYRTCAAGGGVAAAGAVGRRVVAGDLARTVAGQVGDG